MVLHVHTGMPFSQSKTEIPAFMGTGKNLQDTAVSEISQAQKEQGLGV